MFFDLEEGVAELFADAQRLGEINADHRLFRWALRQLEAEREVKREWWRKRRMTTSPRGPRLSAEERHERRLASKRAWARRDYARRTHARQIA